MTAVFLIYITHSGLVYFHVFRCAVFVRVKFALYERERLLFSPDSPSCIII